MSRPIISLVSDPLIPADKPRPLVQSHSRLVNTHYIVQTNEHILSGLRNKPCSLDVHSVADLRTIGGGGKEGWGSRWNGVEGEVAEDGVVGSESIPTRRNGVGEDGGKKEESLTRLTEKGECQAVAGAQEGDDGDDGDDRNQGENEDQGKDRADKQLGEEEVEETEDEEDDGDDGSNDFAVTSASSCADGEVAPANEGDTKTGAEDE
ncbi:Midasin [Sphaceloma murrayae]|uniref:Midasin n=1 Tax=Sphaceloma murrayae TaxID=2082308 RepID=A0A2K1QWF7_9PEZI|nr:Midasin [Sphaceloma murrayae]